MPNARPSREAVSTLTPRSPAQISSTRCCCSPMGANREIVQSGLNGWPADRSTQWQHALEQLVVDAALRQRMGRAGRAIVEQH